MTKRVVTAGLFVIAALPCFLACDREKASLACGSDADCFVKDGERCVEGVCVADTTPPAITADRSGWYTDSARVTLTVEDEESGVAWIKTVWDSGDPCAEGTDYTTPLAVPYGQDGLRSLLVCAANKVGLTATETIGLGVDKTPPPAATTDKTGWVTDAGLVSILAVDPESGIHRIHYRWDAPASCDTSPVYTAPLTVLTGTGQLHALNVCVRNNAGLETVTGIPLAADTTPPLTPSLSCATVHATSRTVEATFATSDPESGVAVAGLEYRRAVLDGTGRCGAYAETFERPTLDGNTFEADAGYCYEVRAFGESFAGLSAVSAETCAVTVDHLRFAALAGLHDAVCGLTAAGAVWCWGANLQLLLDVEPSNYGPVAVDLSGLAAGDQAFVSLAAGSQHACGLTARGKAYCFGQDSLGQLGNDAEAQAMTTPVAVDMSNLPADERAFVAMGAGGGVTCAVTVRGRPVCWGDNRNRELGVGSTADAVFLPTLVDTSGLPTEDRTFQKIAPAWSYTCGLSSVGRAYCWGSNGYGQFGRGAVFGTQALPVAMDVSGLPSDDQRFVDLVTGSGQVCLLSAQHVAYCLGNDDSGQLGDDAASQRKYYPTPVNIGGVLAAEPRFRQLSAGTSHTCALSADGSLSCWGGDYFGALGDGGDDIARYLPIRPDLSSLASTEHVFRQVVAGGAYSCALSMQGSVACWGLLPLPPNLALPYRVPTDFSLAGHVATQTRFVKLYGAGTTACGLDVRGQGRCWGECGTGECGAGTAHLSEIDAPRADTTIDLVSLDAGDQSLVTIGMAERHACGVSGRGRVYCWGDDHSFQLGDDGQVVQMNRPVPIDTATVASGEQCFTAVAAGNSHSCGLTAAGTVYCWGDNTFGQLGNGTTGGSSTTPTLVVTVGMPADDRRFVEVQAGQENTCARTAAGHVYCWGSNSEGKLGDGTAIAMSGTPVALSVTGLPAEDQVFRRLAVGRLHACALGYGGNAYCWGWNYAGELGSGDARAFSNLPVAVVTTGLPADESHLLGVSAGSNITCVTTSAGASYCFGLDDFGALGNGAPLENLNAPAIATVTSALPPATFAFTSISPMSYAGCGLLPDGQAACWGDVAPSASATPCMVSDAQLY